MAKSKKKPSKMERTVKIVAIITLLVMVGSVLYSLIPMFSFMNN
ncbi:DUF4044 domain-containing protein [Eremococcus coleocola]